MKKNFKFMLVALMALFSYNAMAQDPVVGTTLNDEDYYYKVTKIVKNTETEKIAEVAITALNGDKAGEITIPGTFDKKFSGNTWTINVVKINYQVFLDQVALTKVNFKKQLRVIDGSVFQGCTLLSAITFEEGSELSEIWDWAFATTQITDPDFSKCKQLSLVRDYLFTEGSIKTNSYVKTITLPKSPLLKSIGKAFANLPEMTSLNVNETLIESLDANAFNKDAKLTSMVLPASLKTIAAKAFEGSNVEDLTIDLTSIATIGNGTTAVYGDNAGKVLKKLTFINALKGVIDANAFAGEKLIGSDVTKYAGSDVLNMESVALGTTGQIKKDAFKGIDKVKKVVLGEISNNTTGVYTIAGEAFSGAILEEVVIGNILTNQAIGAKAFGDKLKKVTIGNIYTAGVGTNFPIAANAFTFQKANATIIIGNVRSTDHANTVMDASAFDLSALDNTTDITITIGAVEAKAKNFATGSFKVPESPKSLSVTFTGNIEAGALDVAILSSNKGLTAATFKGTVGANGIGAGAFAGAIPSATRVLTVTFEKELAPAALNATAFQLAGVPAGDGKKVMVVDYKSATHTNTFISGMPWAQTTFYGALVTELDRDIEVKIANAALKATFEANQADDATDITFRALFKVTAPTNFFNVYGDNNNLGTSYARIVLPAGKYKIDRRPVGKDYDEVDQTGITYNLFTVYKEEDEPSKVTTLNMLPMVSTDGWYYIDASAPLVVIVRAQGTAAVNDAVTKMWYEPWTGTEAKSNKYDGDGCVKVATKVVTNQQLRDGTGNTGLENLSKSKLDANNVYLLTNPENHEGIKAVALDYEHYTTPFINSGNFYALGKKYTAAPARMIINWYGESEATAIVEAKTAKAANNDAIYNLQGIRVNGAQKGIYIQNGKKFIVK